MYTNISKLFADSLEPSCDFGLLQQDTELHFVPPEPESHKPSINQPQPTTMLGSLVNNYFNLSHMDVSFNEFCNRPMYARVCSLGPQKPGKIDQIHIFIHRYSLLPK